MVKRLLAVAIFGICLLLGSTFTNVEAKKITAGSSWEPLGSDTSFSYSLAWQRALIERDILLSQIQTRKQRLRHISMLADTGLFSQKTGKTLPEIILVTGLFLASIYALSILWRLARRA